MDLSRRQRQDEWMDAVGVDPRRLERSLRFIRIVNVSLGYRRATLSHLQRFSRNWKPGETIRVLDVATGSGDIPLKIARWGRRVGFDIRVTGLDRHPGTAAVAAQRCRNEPNIQVVRGDALHLPFPDRGFDYAITNMFIHHLDDDDVVTVLREMDRVANRGVVVGDLLRRRRAYAWICLFTVLANPMVKHDARVSVAQAFNESEIKAIRARAALTYARYHAHFGHRFVLAGEKPRS